MDVKKIVKLITVVAALVGGGLGYNVVFDDPSAEPSAKESSVETPPVRDKPSSAKPAVRIEPSAKDTPTSIRISAEKRPERARCVFASFKDGEWVTGWGRIKKILPDDTVPPCHQRFLLVDPTGETLLIANNIDRWPRLADIHVGDIVEFKGEFKDGERGYLVHWTHPDTSGRRPGGYVRKGR